jgi:hypothetical protein
MKFGKEIIDVYKLFDESNDKIKLITDAYNHFFNENDNYLLEIATGIENSEIPVSAIYDVYHITKNDQGEVIVQTLGTSIITGQPKLVMGAPENIGSYHEFPTFELLINFFKRYVNDITQIAVYDNIGQTVLIKKFGTNSFGKTRNSLKNIMVDIKYLEKI